MTLDEYGARLGKILGAANVAGLDPPTNLDELVGACHLLGLDLVAAAGIVLGHFTGGAAEVFDQVEGDGRPDERGRFLIRYGPPDFPRWDARPTREECYAAVVGLGAGDYQIGPHAPEDWYPDELVRVAPDGSAHVLGPSNRWRAVEL